MSLKLRVERLAWKAVTFTIRRILPDNLQYLWALRRVINDQYSICQAKTPDRDGSFSE